MIQTLIKKFRRNRSGFTLIELIVVIAILGILAAVLIPTITNVVSDAKTAAGKSDVQAAFMAAQLAATKLQEGTKLAACTGSSDTANFSADKTAITGSSYWASLSGSTTIDNLVVDADGNVTNITITSHNATSQAYHS